MNALLSIQVNVLSRQATAQIAALQKQMTAMQTAQAAGATKARGFGSALAMSAVNIEKFGKNVQWSGRQLEYNFTLPLVLAGGAATKWALDNERAMVRVRKVYGEFGADVEAELVALENSFELLSNRFGVAKAEVTDIGAAWAQAGAAGVAVAKATRATLEAMILGSFDAAQATQNMIAVQSAYRLNTEELNDALSTLNAVENNTSINLGGLIEVITRAGGASRAAGIDLRHLAAMASTLVPAAGTASQAGNSLRTIFSRLLSPTKQAAGILNEMGLAIDSVAWLSQNGTERLESLSIAFKNLTQNQQAVVSSTVASRWQINRFNLLMEDVYLSLDESTRGLSSYGRALDVTADQSQTAALKARELTEVLQSSPRAFEILTTNIKNAMAKAIMPLLPTLISLLAEITKLIKKFTELPAATQKTILTFALMLAVIGPITRYVGTFAILIGTLGRAFHFMIKAMVVAATGLKLIVPIFAKVFLGILSAILGVKGAIIAVVVGLVIGLVYLFRNQLRDPIIAAFNALPAAIQAPLMSVLRMLQSFARAAYGYLQYLNPFARHSPSLVDNVTAGVTTILDQYSRLNGVKAVISEAIRAHRGFLAATGAASRNFQMEEFKMKRNDIVAVAPGAGPAVDSLVSSIFRMRGALESVNEQLRHQSRIVYDLEQQISTAMKPMNDAIFENEMAQKRLRLEMLRMEQDGGGSLDDIKRKYAEINGMIEKMTGQREDLRLSGAGSEITGTFDREINGLKEQRKAIEGQAAPMDEMRRKMEELQRQGEIMRLERDIEFDPQLRHLDEERNKLREIETAYRDIESAIRDMESALNEMASGAASQLAREAAAKSAAEAAAKATGADAEIDRTAFDMAGDADFEVPGGSAPPGLGREGGLDEIEEFNRLLEAELAEALANMGGVDLFQPIRDAWNRFKDWWEENVVGTFERVRDGIGNIFSSISNPFGDLEIGDRFDSLSGSIGGAFDHIRESLSGLVDYIQLKWDTIFAIVSDVLGWLVGKIKDTGRAIWDELKNWDEVFNDLWLTVQFVFERIALAVRIAMGALITIFSVGFVAIRAAWEMFWPIIRNTFSGIWDAITAILVGAIEVLRGIIISFLALVRGDWDRLREGLTIISDALWRAVHKIFQAALDIIIGIFSGFIEGIIRLARFMTKTLTDGIFKPLGDALGKIFNTIKDHLTKSWDNTWRAISWVWDNTGKKVFEAIIWFIQVPLTGTFDAFRATADRIWNLIGSIIRTVWNSIIKPIWDAIKWYIDNQLVPAFHFWRDKAKAAFEAIGGGLKWVWDNVLKKIFETVINFIHNQVAPAFHWLASKIGDAWSAIRTMAAGAWNGILNIIGTAVNNMLNIVNTLIRGINRLSSLPGISINISEIGHVSWGQVSAGSGGGGGGGAARMLAQGTDRIPEHPFERKVGGGFKTNNVRAIVGEGNPLYPEYVIPTDPNFRGRAMGLAGALLNDLGLNNFNELHPQYASGGNVPHYFMGGILDLAGDAWDATGGRVVSGIRKGAAMAIFGPINAAAKALIDRIPFQLTRETANMIRETMYNWVKQTDDKVPDAPDVTGEGGATWLQMWRAVKDRFPWAQLHSGYRPGSITTSGNLSYHARGRAIDVTPSMDIFNWLHGNYPNSRELIFSPAGGRQVRNGRPHMYTGAVRNMHWDHVHWAMQQGGIIPSLAKGGIVLPRPGGTLVRLGEGGQAEAVQPLPRDFATGKTFNFYGDLSFPNITDPNDAETFIANLESLV